MIIINYKIVALLKKGASIQTGASVMNHTVNTQIHHHNPTLIIVVFVWLLLMVYWQLQ